MIIESINNILRTVRNMLFRRINEQIHISEIKHHDGEILVRGWANSQNHDQIAVYLNNDFIKNIETGSYRPDVFKNKLSKTPFCGFNTSLEMISNTNTITLSVLRNGNVSSSTTKEYNIVVDKKITSNKAINRLIPVDRRKKESIWLNDYKFNKYTRYGEDGLIKKIFETVGANNKFCVEFGAGNGVDLSNTRSLIDEGWSGVFIEPSESYSALEDNYKNNGKVDTMRSLVELEGDNKIDSLLKKSKLKVPIDLDFMSIDIDGCDVHVFNTLEVYKPRVICIEFNQFIPNDVYYIQENDMEINHGSSLLAMIDKFKVKDYELISTTGGNAFFVKSELFKLFKIDDNSIDSIHFFSLETNILQMPNGDLVLSGMTKHPWKGFNIDQEAIQVLPKNMRKWKFNGNIWPKDRL